MDPLSIIFLEKHLIPYPPDFQHALSLVFQLVKSDDERNCRHFIYRNLILYFFAKNLWGFYEIGSTFKFIEDFISSMHSQRYTQLYREKEKELCLVK